MKHDETQNELQGKFGQRSTLSKKKYFSDPAEYFAFMWDPTNVIDAVDIISEHMVCVTYCKAEEFVEVGLIFLSLMSITFFNQQVFKPALQ